VLLILFHAALVQAADADLSKLPPPATRDIDFAADVQPIFAASCLQCHGDEKQKGGLRLDRRDDVLKGGDAYGPSIIPGDSGASPLIRIVAGLDEDMMMPQKGDSLTAEQIGVLRAWIDQGAKWPQDAAGNIATEVHWSFKPVTRPEVPQLHGETEVRNPIDAFIINRLQQDKLTPSPPVDRRTLIRRASFDLTGLPPTPEEMDAFLADKRPDAYEQLVERLLASPRYGERWARHWLDIVRFAETTGYEVNTPRSNAWPYRDYVIKALNEDKPYNQFIREQLAGDIYGVDAATGFLVGGSDDQVKSPDIVLTSQQRSDELHDMVATTGSTFLGMSVGCARCHNHKFDPIPQSDYTAMVAVFAGVQHGERPLRTDDSQQRLTEARELRQRVTEIEGRLTQYEPLANPQAVRKPLPVNPRLNEETFDSALAKFVRFTIHETTDIEPCIDELEVYTTDGRNIALAAAGTKATASGTYPNSPLHRLEHVNDGRVGNSHSWISSEIGAGWVQLEFTEPATIDRIVWGRDREEVFKDRLATSYTIEAGENAEALRPIAGHTFARPAVHPRMNAERFAPVTAKRLRFTVNETSGLEPCIDELEVYTTDGRNVALASAGAKATASSEYPNAAIHKIAHVNDGQVGNNHSWISSETSKGWVELEFPQPVVVNKVVWGRDRQEVFKDRLAIDYRLEVSRDDAPWTVVASSADRQRYVPGRKYTPILLSSVYDAEASSLVRELLAERTRCEQKIAELTTEPMVYAGTFAPPPPTHRLHRGDPMQKREVVQPGALSIVPVTFQRPSQSMELTEEQSRRVALAEWITDERNPLTARVMVNRIWQYHFGEALVSTSSDFGANGSKPSHPELLDWLASELIARGWSIKAMHRLIVTSATYRQASAARADAMAVDASSRLLWRYPPRRLEAEPIRDTMLAVSGVLDLRMGGPGYSVFEPNDNYVRVYNPKEQYGPAEWRRMIYMTKVRMQQDATFGAFDCPDGGQIAPKRTVSTTPLQALNLLNSGFVLQQADLFAERLKREQPDNVMQQVQRAFALAFGRDATNEEAAVAVKFIEAEGLTMFCRALLNANEFVYVY
jgi:mono/diheme cytochrome c family protein